MKPRTKFEKRWQPPTRGWPPSAQKAVDWAIRNVVKHISFRTSGHKCTCGDCGGEFDYKGRKVCTLPPTVDTVCRRLIRWHARIKRHATFSTLEAVDGMQVQRVFLLTVNYRKGKPMEAFCNEVCRLWLDSKGKTAVTSLARTLGYYKDSLQLGFIHRTEEHDRCSLGYLQYIRLSLLFRHT